MSNLFLDAKGTSKNPIKIGEFTLTLQDDTTLPGGLWQVDGDGNLEPSDQSNPGDSAYAEGSFGITIDGSGVAITTGIKGYLTMPYACVIKKWYIVADQSGSIVVDILKAAGSIPVASIAGSELPTLTGQQLNSDTNLTTWTTIVAAGDIIGFTVLSVATVTRVTLVIAITK
jgi:hypothetical protein